MAINFDLIKNYNNSIKMLSEKLDNPKRFTRKEAEAILTYQRTGYNGYVYTRTKSDCISFPTLVDHNLLTVAETEEFPLTKKARNIGVRYCVYDDSTNEMIDHYDSTWEANQAIKVWRKARPNHTFSFKREDVTAPEQTITGIRYYYTLNTEKFDRIINDTINERKEALLKQQDTVNRKIDEINSALVAISQTLQTLQDNHA